MESGERKLDVYIPREQLEETAVGKALLEIRDSLEAQKTEADNDPQLGYILTLQIIYDEWESNENSMEDVEGFLEYVKKQFPEKQDRVDLPFPVKNAIKTVRKKVKKALKKKK